MPNHDIRMNFPNLRPTLAPEAPQEATTKKGPQGPCPLLFGARRQHEGHLGCQNPLKVDQVPVRDPNRNWNRFLSRI